MRMLSHSARLLAATANPGVARGLAGAVARGRMAAAWRMARTVARPPDLGAEKIVSRQYRYMWLCNPKVASRSIRSALLEVTPDAEVFTGKSVAEVLALRPEARHYHSFAFIRHPFTRALSFHAELRFAPCRYTDGPQRRCKLEKTKRFLDRFHGLADIASFDGYCRWLCTPYASDRVADRHILSQYVQLRLGDGRWPDYIGRFENLDADFRQVAEHLGFPAPELPVLNTMAGWQAAPAALEAARSAMRAHLDERNEALLRARYSTDLDLGGYSSP